MIRLLIVDDHDLVRSGLKNMLSAAGGIDVVGEAGTGEQAIRLNRELKPDVILMDIGLPGLSGFETSDRIMHARPEVRIIVLTAHTRPPYTTRMLQMGAAGYLTKACDAEELVSAVRKVADGQRFIGTEIAQQLAMSLLPGAPQSPFQELTPRELEIALMIARGLKPTDIGQRLSISTKTISTHKRSIFDKIGVESEVGLLREAIRHQLIEPDDE
ncbi:MAG: response regulator [Wenzhouxiangellaceae bacterium]|nr:response regulator [Wenzhouxiangellaceae bacterium]